MLSIWMNQCRCLVQALVGFDVNVARLVGGLVARIDGDPVVLEMWRVNFCVGVQEKTSGRQRPDVAVQVSSRAGPVQTRCNALKPLPRGL